MLSLPHPFIGISPMDGVTDAAFREITAQISHPDCMFTEFVTVEGVSRGAVRPLEAFMYGASERPIIAQVYGIEVAAFTTLAQIVAALGFDGLDINMGCPAKKVVHRGAGAGLITNPELAAQIIAAARAGLDQWENGMAIDAIAVPAKVLKRIKEYRARAGVTDEQTRSHLPLSVKTRIGYDTPVIDEWFGFLATQPVDMITIHGRTLKQQYTGEAAWDQIATAARVIKQQNPTCVVVGNGDIKSVAQAKEYAKKYGVDGVLIGRAALGNPWVLTDHIPTVEERKATAIAHARLFAELYPPQAFSAFRRHLAAYIKHMPSASTLRGQLMQATDAASVERILNSPTD